MMRFKNWVLNFALFLMLIILIIPQVRANPIFIYGPDYFGPLFFLYLFILFSVAYGIESLVILSFQRENKVLKTSTTFYKTVFIVNLISFPLTQLFAYFIFQTKLSDYDLGFVLLISILIEVFPITLESLLYMKFFKEANKILYYDYPVRNKVILYSTITANLLSFGFGLLTYNFTII